MVERIPSSNFNVIAIKAMQSTTKSPVKWRMEIVNVDTNEMFAGIVIKGRVNNGGVVATTGLCWIATVDGLLRKIPLTQICR